MSRCTLRSIFTVLLYAGVGIFLSPYLTGHFSNAILFLVIGISLAVLCGVLRCCFADGDCTERQYIDAKASGKPTSTHPHVPSHP